MRKSFIFVSLLFIVALTGCVQRVITEGYEASRTIDLLKFEAPADAGRVYFLNGNLTGFTLNTRHLGTSSLFLNDSLVGSVNEQDVMVADIIPGTYEIFWAEDPKNLGGYGSKAEKQVISINSGEYYVIKANFNVGGTGFGLLGSLLAPPFAEIFVTKDTSNIGSLNLVKPISCTSKICKK